MTKEVTSSQSAKILYHQFRHLQRRNRAVSRFAESPVSLIQLHLLIEISSEQSVAPAVLADNLMISRQECSRLCKPYLTDGTIRYGNSNNARKPLVLTAKGRELVAQLDKTADDRLQEIFRNCSKSSMNHLAEIMRAIGNRWHVPRGTPRPHEHVLRYEIRRLTRAFGLIGRTTFNHPVNATEWHVLAALHSEEQANSIRQMSQAFDLLENSLRLVLRRLESRKLVIQIPSPEGKRAGKFELTRKGEHFIQNVEDFAVSQIQKAIDACSIEEIEGSIDVLKKVTGWPKEGVELVNRRISDSGELLVARRLYLKTISTQLDSLNIPPLIYEQHSNAYALFRGKEMVACAVRAHNTRRKEASLIGFDSTVITPKMLREFIVMVLGVKSDRDALSQIPKDEVARSYGWR